MKWITAQDRQRLIFAAMRNPLTSSEGALHPDHGVRIGKSAYLLLTLNA